MKINHENPKLFMIEQIPGVDYEKLIDICEMPNSTTSSSWSKAQLQNLLTLAQSDRERELVRYATFKASGLTVSAAKCQYGFGNMNEQAARVEAFIKESLHIRETIKHLSEDQETAVMQFTGIYDLDSDSCSEVDSFDSDCLPESSADNLDFPFDEVVAVLFESKFNWFEVVDKIIERFDCDDEQPIINQLSKLFPKLLETCQTTHDKMLLKQSYQAFLNYSNSHQLEAERCINSLNSFIVTDSERDDPDQYIGLNETSEKPKAIITTKRKTIKQRSQYLISKAIASQNFLKKKQSCRINTIVKDYSTIGKIFEDFVQSCNVGADAWRRTGVLTFDENVRIKSNHIQQDT